MVAISLQQFIGEQPRIVPRQMPERAAQSAINTRLDDGALTPIRQPLEEHDPSPSDWSTYQTIHKHDGTWYGWSGIVHAARGPVASDRLYFTGDGVPKVKISGTDYDLAVPAATAALTATLDGSGTGDVITRIYVYTFVTGDGEESEPNAVSNEINWQNGNTVTLSGFQAAPAGRNITNQRIYRSQTGQTGTFFYLVADRSASASDFDDTIAVDDFQEILPSQDWNTPPDTLSGLTALPNGMMAAFDGQKLYFCEPYHPHAYPEKYILTVDYDIVAIEAAGPILVVMTEGNPYVVTGSAPEAMQSTKLEYNAPCINARGVVGLGYAVAYPSHDGLVLIDAGGGVRYATEAIFKREDWLEHSPSTINAAQLSGRYVAFYDTTNAVGAALTGAMIIDTGGDGFLIRNGTKAVASFFDITTSNLFYLDPATGLVMELDAAAAPRENLYWKSKQFSYPLPVGFAGVVIDADETLSVQEVDNIATRNAAIIAANQVAIAAGPINGDLNSHAINSTRVNGDDLTPLVADRAEAMTATVYADGVAIATITETNKMKRLPGDRTARNWEVDVFGSVQVLRIAMASTIDELRLTP